MAELRAMDIGKGKAGQFFEDFLKEQGKLREANQRTSGACLPSNPSAKWSGNALPRPNWPAACIPAVR